MGSIWSLIRVPGRVSVNGCGAAAGHCGCAFFFSSRRRHTRFDCDWSSDVCSSDLLAATRAKVLTPEEMLPRLRDRLSLLSSGARTLPQRQRTLRDAIAWSHDLLDDPERRLFARLSVF